MNTTCPKHLSSRSIVSSDLEATRRFYAAFFDTNRMIEGPCLVCTIGKEALSFGLPAGESTRRAEGKRDGVSRIVFGVEDDQALRRLAERLNARNVRHSGIYADLADASKLHLHDPDGIRVEFVTGIVSSVVVHFA